MKAKATMAANGNNITIAITEAVNSTTPMLEYFQGLQPEMVIMNRR